MDITLREQMIKNAEEQIVELKESLAKTFARRTEHSSIGPGGARIDSTQEIIKRTERMIQTYEDLIANMKKR